MTIGKRKTKSELLSEYDDPVWQDKFLKLLDLVRVLENCVLRESYRIPDDLNNAIALTDAGNRVARALASRHDVNVKEARLMAFLQVAYCDPLVDISAVDIEQVRDAIHTQILERDLMHPFIFGRTLYDRAANLFEYRRRWLPYEETIRLLADTPEGVFQSGYFVTGPLGLLRSTAKRDLSPTVTVPLFHCSDVTCPSVHRCRLSTDERAPINADRHKIRVVLKEHSSEGSEWSLFAQEIQDSEQNEFDDMDMSTLPYLVGDALSDVETKVLFANLLDRTQGHFRSIIASYGFKGSASEIVERLDHATTLQLILLLDDERVAGALDDCVQSGQICVPQGEVRRPVVNRSIRSGNFSVRTELGSRGVRVRESGGNVAVLRLKRLLDAIYADGGSDASQELAWQLRTVEASTQEGKLEEYLRNSDPAEVLHKLVLTKRAHAQVACESLGIRNSDNLDDKNLTQAILWKLGFSLADLEDQSERFWREHEKMRMLTQTVGVTASVNEDEIRGNATLYFVRLEELLDDSLGYVTWGLTYDHLKSDRPFVFNYEMDRKWSFERLSAAESARSSGPELIEFGEKNSLYPLCRGFGALANHLNGLAGSSGDYVRDEDEYPEYVGKTEIQKYPFGSTIPFLNLIDSAQATILDRLDRVSKLLVGADVNEVRNELLHFRRSTADLSRLTRCLDAVEEAVKLLDAGGMIRSLYGFKSRSLDNWGRGVVKLEDSHGRSIALAIPSRYSWLPLPARADKQYLMVDAVFDAPNEFLRFGVSYDSEFSKMWMSYPMLKADSVDNRQGEL